MSLKILRRAGGTCFGLGGPRSVGGSAHLLPLHAIRCHTPKSFQVSMPKHGNLETFSRVSRACMNAAAIHCNAEKKGAGLHVECLALFCDG